MTQPPLIVITGPTASGKSALALELARHVGGQIVGCDSVQIYRHLDIGSAKPSPAVRREIPHHLIDLLDPAQECSAGDYRRLAEGVLADLWQRQIPPILVGGSGFYLRALLEGLFHQPPIPPALREKVRADIAARGTKSLYRQLQELDPEAALSIKPNDSYRLARALEVYLATGRSLLSFWRERDCPPLSCRTLKIALAWPRAELYRRIDRRAEEIFHNGLLSEVAALLKNGYSPTLKPLQSLGYREAILALSGKMNEKEALEETKKKTRQFAKRQLTWFRRSGDIHWFEPNETHKVINETERFLRWADSP